MQSTADSAFHHSIRLTWHVALAIATMMCALALAPRLSSACSVFDLRRPAALGRDGSLVYVSTSSDPDRPGVHTLRWFDRHGTPTAAHEIDTGVPRGPEIAALEDDGSAWLHIPCSSLATEERCARLAEVHRDGRRGHEVSLGKYQTVTRREDGSFLTGTYGEAAVSLLDLETGEPLTIETGISLGTEVTPSESGTTRVRDSEGGWLVVRNTEEEVILRRIDAHGIERIERRYPIAREDRPAGSTSTALLGPLGRLIIDPSGYVLAPQWATHEETCNIIQPPGVAIFDRDLVLRGVAAISYGARQARVIDGELVVLVLSGQVERFHLDGRSARAPWRPSEPEGHAAAALSSVVEDAAAALASMGPGDPPEVLSMLHYYVADEEQQEQISRWLVEAGPAMDDLDDYIWMTLAEPMCMAHPSTAPAEAARRFARSIGDHRVRWLAALTSCFDRAPPDALALAAHLLRLADTDYRHTDSAHCAYSAWGYPPDLLDSLWADALGSPSNGRSIERLLMAFAKLEEGFSRRLASDDQLVRWRVFEMLLMTLDAWHEDRLDDLEVRQVARARPALLRAAAGWVSGDDPRLAILGRLLRLAHGADDAAAQLAPLLSASKAMPTLLRDIALALRCAHPREAPAWSAPEERAAWEDFLALVRLGRSIPPHPESLMRYTDAWRWVEPHLGSPRATAE